LIFIKQYDFNADFNHKVAC